MKVDFQYIEACLMNEKKQLHKALNDVQSTSGSCINERELNLYICDSFNPMAIQPEINAYSVYCLKDDRIYVTKELCNLIIKLFTGMEIDARRVSWMVYLASIFCVTHEFSHLYAGHCQLNDENFLSMMPNNKVDNSMLEYQTMEYIADWIAGCEVAEKIHTSYTYRSEIPNINSLFYLENEEEFIKDSFFAIQGFFLILRYLERDKECYWNGSHPPSLARYIYTSHAMRRSLYDDYNIEINEKDIDSKFEANNYLCCQSLGIGVKELFSFNDRGLTKDNSIYDYQVQLINHWKNMLKPKTEKFNRIPNLL